MIKVDAPPIAIPHGLKFLVMLAKKAVDRDSIAVYFQSGIARITSPCRAGAVVRAPQPEIVSDNVVGVNRDAIGGRAFELATHAADNVVNTNLFCGMTQRTCPVSNSQ